MNLSKDGKWVYCHICNKDTRITTQCYFYNNEIRCLECDTVLGYIWDLHKQTVV